MILVLEDFTGVESIQNSSNVFFLCDIGDNIFTITHVMHDTLDASSAGGI